MRIRSSTASTTRRYSVTIDTRRTASAGRAQVAVVERVTLGARRLAGKHDRLIDGVAVEVDVDRRQRGDAPPVPAPAPRIRRDQARTRPSELPRRPSPRAYQGPAGSMRRPARPEGRPRGAARTRRAHHRRSPHGRSHRRHAGRPGRRCGVRLPRVVGVSRARRRERPRPRPSGADAARQSRRPARLQRHGQRSRRGAWPPRRNGQHGVALPAGALRRARRGPLGPADGGRSAGHVPDQHGGGAAHEEGRRRPHRELHRLDCGQWPPALHRATCRTTWQRPA